jgi:hypothetical protein
VGRGKVTFVDPSTRKVSLLMTEAEIAQKVKEWSLEDSGNLLMLCDEYDIPYSKDLSYTWYSLALALARRWHPAPKKRGTHEKWNLWTKGALVVEVERLIKQKGKGSSVRWACVQLAKEEPWKSFVGNNTGDYPSENPSEVLRRKYQDVYSDQKLNLLRTAYKAYSEENDFQGWNDYLHSVVRKKKDE